MARRPRRPNVILKNEHKAFLVQRLAVFDSPKEAADALKAEFGLEISVQRAEAYDPDKRAGQRLGQQWRDLFEATRKHFLEKLDDIPAANKAVRVRRLDRMSLAAERRGNFALAASLLKQVAEEVGNVYTNRREHTGKDGGAIKHEYRDVGEMTDEEIRAEMRKLMADKELLDFLAEDPDAADPAKH